MIWVPILVAVACSALSFGAGVRYGTTKLLPVILARMTNRELEQLGRKTVEERKANAANGQG